MQLEYTPIAKNQKDNPYYKMRTRDQAILEKELQDRLLFLCQLGSSKDKTDKEVYKLLANTPMKAEFGSAPHYGNQANTGLAALAGAIGKLRTGDLSQKQISHIMPTLEVLSKVYPDKFSSITFVERGTANVKVHLSEIFEVIDGE